jgi:cell division septum initiation protein DivIVA
VPAGGSVDGHVVLDAPVGQARAGRRRRRPNLSGDLRTMLQEPPSFRRSVRGYDRLQVDNYVRWAEEEFLADARTLDDLLMRHTRLRADLDEAHRLLHHSATGREFLHLATRVGAVLCVAADEATGLREDAATEAERVTEKAAADARRVTDEAAAEAERVSMEARAEAAARLAKAREIEQRAGEDATSAREQARRDADGILQAARGEAARLLAEAAQQRERLDQEARTRRAGAERAAEALEQRCVQARAYLDRMAGQVTEVLTALGSPPPDAAPTAPPAAVPRAVRAV